MAVPINLVDFGAGRSKSETGNPVEKRVQGGGGGDMTELEARVKRLEEDGREARIDLKTIIRDLTEVRASMATSKDLVDLKVAVAKVETRIDKLPTIAKLSAFIGIAVAILTIVVRWHDVVAYFKGG